MEVYFIKFEIDLELKLKLVVLKICWNFFVKLSRLLCRLKYSLKEKINSETKLNFT